MFRNLKPFFIIIAAAAAALLLAFVLKEDSSGDENTDQLFSEMKRNCGTVEYNKSLMNSDESYRKNLEEIDKYLDSYLKEHKGESDNLVVTIPVVVHVVYNVNSPQQNISHSQVLSQIKVLNDDFRRRNSDTTLTPVPFRQYGADIQIEFCLAKRDPNDNPSLGVTRTATTVTQFGLDDAVKFNSSGGHDAWNRNKYLNLWVCNLEPPTLGYAQFPGGPAITDGVVIGYQYFGTIGTAQAPFNLGRTTTHEVGHWFYLFHIWGDDNGSCGGSDQVDDTPNQGPEYYNCPNFPQLDACSPVTPGVMFMNYMDYTDDRCMNIFTLGQSERMNTVLNTYRPQLLTSSGCSPVSGVPIAMFSADSLSILYSNPVHFSDQSAGIPTAWNWNFPGGTPSSSSLQAPAVVYNAPGYYSVSLRVSNTFGTDSVTYNNYIRVRGAVMNPFNVLSPPSFTRIQVTANDPVLEHFTWQRTNNNPSTTYKFKIRKLSSQNEFIYQSNNSGHDTVVSFRRSFLDTLALTMGTLGDSVRCTWRVWAYNGIDSSQTQNAFIVSFARNVIGIQKISSEIPGTFALYNNYPNPFNPETIIKFDIPASNQKNTFVTLKIYDITGRETAVLVNENLSPGTYSASWNAAEFSSGIYFYRIDAGQFSQTRKMILIK